MNTETDNLTTSKKNLADRLIHIFETLSLALMAIPFASMALWILGSAFLEGDYFFFFPVAMFTFLPAGMFALGVQLARLVRKRPASLFGTFMVGASIFTIIIGILGWMAVYVATG